MEIYTVKQGDTINSIANIFNLTPEQLLNTNPIPNPDNLVVGQDLIILIPDVTYTTTENDTLYSIANKYNVSVSSILRNNPNLSSNNLLPNTTITISYKDVSPSRLVVVNGYTYPEINIEKLVKILPYLTFLTIFTYGFDESGQLISPNDTELIALANDFGVLPTMLVSTLTKSGTFSNELARLLLNSNELQDILISNIIQTMEEKGYKAVDVDFEYLPVENRDSYISFIQKLTKKANEKGFYTLVALAPKTSTNQPGLLYESHSYSGLGNSANFSLLMTYEWGYSAGPPLPVAPLPNVEQVISYGVTQIPPYKILMGIPLYGYNWTLPYTKGTIAKSLSPEQAVELALETNSQIEYDYLQQAPYFNYTQDNAEHIVWFENLKSIDAKLNLVEKYKLGGVGLWNITRDFPQFYILLNSRFQIARL